MLTSSRMASRSACQSTRSICLPPPVSAAPAAAARTQRARQRRAATSRACRRPLAPGRAAGALRAVHTALVAGVGDEVAARSARRLRIAAAAVPAPPGYRDGLLAVIVGHSLLQRFRPHERLYATTEGHQQRDLARRRLARVGVGLASGHQLHETSHAASEVGVVPAQPVGERRQSPVRWNSSIQSCCMVCLLGLLTSRADAHLRRCGQGTMRPWPARPQPAARPIPQAPRRRRAC